MGNEGRHQGIEGLRDVPFAMRGEESVSIDRGLTGFSLARE